MLSRWNLIKVVFKSNFSNLISGSRRGYSKESSTLSDETFNYQLNGKIYMVHMKVVKKEWLYEKDENK